ncbi:VTT domain-containing protein [Paraneptunicella aestuarii]|uniref:TVP38/TMEM64 family protein n=1 Tax=Paraneptunicella aestuarii TaxID=2831148 RepID=UPI001E3AC79C|nr:VTT domain-containing protein [Paraneptunicella aestuarii]UAA37661.1 VTT domain-containing protein [Paraneptunicella aestuarii]
MTSLIKLILTLALIFISIFLLLNTTGIVTLDKIKVWLSVAQNISPVYVVALVVGLLIVDLIISVPTLALTILSGFFLGAAMGASAAIAGLLLSGSLGYWLSYHYGERYLGWVLKHPEARQEATQSFEKHGTTMIFLSRAVPMLPEISACMAGVTRMPYRKFIAAWLVGCVPYCIIASYAGSISTIENPTPAIIGAVALMTSLWLGWLYFKKRQ